ncbi:hypothetical protein TNCV_4497551 [Trichonephila clavipes]|nr:hypothetical protein TNCV_4497551 [Trichonephila clavipes]
MDYFEQFDAGGDDSYLVKFYKRAAEVLKWGELKGETILFLGRGDENDCRKLLRTFPLIKQILDVNCSNCFRKNLLDGSKENSEYLTSQISSRGAGGREREEDDILLPRGVFPQN